MLPGWVIERIRQKSFVSFESRVCSSLIFIPGTAVEIGLYGPRISAGAAGLRSQVSRWLGPPHRSTKMHDFSAAPCRGLRLPSTRAATMPGVPRPTNPRPLAWSIRRRERRAEGFMQFLGEEGEAGGTV